MVTVTRNNHLFFLIFIYITRLNTPGHEYISKYFLLNFYENYYGGPVCYVN